MAHVVDCSYASSFFPGDEVISTYHRASIQVIYDAINQVTYVQIFERVSSHGIDLYGSNCVGTIKTMQLHGTGLEMNPKSF